jgi:lipopolysaccharide transport system permease protein
MKKNNPKQEYEIVLEPPGSWFHLRLSELWEFRELLYFLVWRDIKVRYKQTILGASWAVIQPLLTMVVFSVIFGKLGKLPSDGIPYPVFTFSALLPWQLFSRSLSDASMSLVGNQNMVTKIYFPRIFLPASSILGGLLDFGISFIVFLILMIFYKIPVTWAIATVPLLLLFCIITSLAVGLWLSALNVRYRDIKYITPFLLQFWMYATPVAYSASLIPEKWRLLYGLNPMTGVVEGFRWALLGQQVSISSFMGISIVAVIVLFVSSLFYFQRMELTFADVV